MGNHLPFAGADRGRHSRSGPRLRFAVLLCNDWLEFMSKEGKTAVRFDVPEAGAEAVLAEDAYPLQCATWETQVLPFY